MSVPLPSRRARQGFPPVFFLPFPAFGSAKIGQFLRGCLVSASSTTTTQPGHFDEPDDRHDGPRSKLAALRDEDPRVSSFRFGRPSKLIEIALVFRRRVPFEEGRRDFALERRNDLLIEPLGSPREAFDVALVNEDACRAGGGDLGGAEAVEQHERAGVDPVGDELEPGHIAHVNRSVAYVADQNGSSDCTTRSTALPKSSRGRDHDGGATSRSS